MLQHQFIVTGHEVSLIGRITTPEKSLQIEGNIFPALLFSASRLLPDSGPACGLGRGTIKLKSFLRFAGCVLV
jgi:hypothetical protein